MEVVSPQLLRWGRADVISHGGGQRSLRLEDWTPTGWYTVGQISRAMGVPREALPFEVLCSEGRHGQRVLCKDEEGRTVYKARWTGKHGQHEEQEQRRGHRGGHRHTR